MHFEPLEVYSNSSVENKQVSVSFFADSLDSFCHPIPETWRLARFLLAIVLLSPRITIPLARATRDTHGSHAQPFHMYADFRIALVTIDYHNIVDNDPAAVPRRAL